MTPDRLALYSTKPPFHPFNSKAIGCVKVASCFSTSYLPYLQKDFALHRPSGTPVTLPMPVGPKYRFPWRTIGRDRTSINTLAYMLALTQLM